MSEKQIKIMSPTFLSLFTDSTLSSPDPSVRIFNTFKESLDDNHYNKALQQQQQQQQQQHLFKHDKNYSGADVVVYLRS